MLCVCVCVCVCLYAASVIHASCIAQGIIAEDLHYLCQLGLTSPDPRMRSGIMHLLGTVGKMVTLDPRPLDLLNVMLTQFTLTVVIPSFCKDDWCNSEGLRVARPATVGCSSRAGLYL